MDNRDPSPTKDVPDVAYLPIDRTVAAANKTVNVFLRWPLQLKWDVPASVPAWGCPSPGGRVPAAQGVHGRLRRVTRSLIAYLLTEFGDLTRPRILNRAASAGWEAQTRSCSARQGGAVERVRMTTRRLRRGRADLASSRYLAQHWGTVAACPPNIALTAFHGVVGVGSAPRLPDWARRGCMTPRHMHARRRRRSSCWMASWRGGAGGGQPYRGAGVRSANPAAARPSNTRVSIAR